MAGTGEPAEPRRALAPLWFAGGLVSVGIGGLGVVVPGLPTTVFFIVAAACFSRSNKRFEQWVLNLPRIGRTVSDYREGLGMPRRSKVVAVAETAPMTRPRIGPTPPVRSMAGLSSGSST